MFDVFLTCAHNIAHYMKTHLCCCIIDTEILSEVLGVGGLNWGMGGGLGVIWVVGVSLDGRRGVYWGNGVDGDCVSCRDERYLDDEEGEERWRGCSGCMGCRPSARVDGQRTCRKTKARHETKCQEIRANK